jgi:hypothetical protein
MNSTKLSVLGLAVLCAVANAACTKPEVKISVNPAQLAAAGPVAVTWKTQDFTGTEITSIPPVSGLPKILTGNAGATDTFNVSATTTFTITGTTPGQTTPFVKIANATVSVAGH